MYSTLYSCPILMTLEFSRKIFKHFSNIKFHKNPSSGSRVIPCGRTDGQTDTTKLIVAFRNFAKAPNKCGCCVSCHILPVGPGFRVRPRHVKFVVEEVMLRRVSLSISAFVCGYYSNSAL